MCMCRGFEDFDSKMKLFGQNWASIYSGMASDVTKLCLGRSCDSWHSEVRSRYILLQYFCCERLILCQVVVLQ